MRLENHLRIESNNYQDERDKWLSEESLYIRQEILERVISIILLEQHELQRLREEITNSKRA